MNTLKIPLQDLLTARHPNRFAVEKLIEAGAPVRFAVQPGVFRDTRADEVIFDREIFRNVLMATNEMQYSWNT